MIKETKFKGYFLKSYSAMETFKNTNTRTLNKMGKPACSLVPGGIYLLLRRSACRPPLDRSLVSIILYTSKPQELKLEVIISEL